MDKPATPYGFTRDGKIYRVAFLDYPEREIGEVRESEESTIAYFTNRFAMAEKKVDTLEKAIEESENKGSYLMKLIHLRESLSKFDALGNYEMLFERMDALEETLQEIISHNRVKNLEIKRALIGEAEEFEHSSDWQGGTEALQEIKDKWIKTGSVAKEYQEEVEGRFNEILDNFYQRRKQFFLEKKELINKRIRRYKEINFEMNRLARSKDKREARNRAKELQVEWREVGKVPAGKYMKLHADFRALSNKIFRDPREGNFKRPESPQRYGDTARAPRKDWVNPEEAITTKRALIREAQQLAQRERDTVSEVQRLQEAWKNSGRISREKSIELTDIFNKACDKATERSFLNRLARAKSAMADIQDEKDEVLLKIDLLEKSIARDEQEVSASREASRNASARPDPRVDGKIRAQARKINAKKELLQELQETLSELE